jgi:3-deoxy-7-phosphoheptulonate synthase
MARAAIAAGADALMLEIHDDPEHAMSDGFQALTPPVFVQVMQECRRVAAALDRTLG